MRVKLSPLEVGGVLPLLLDRWVVRDDLALELGCDLFLVVFVVIGGGLAVADVHGDIGDLGLVPEAPRDDRLGIV